MEEGHEGESGEKEKWRKRRVADGFFRGAGDIWTH